ncbi:sugar phosphate isomerase/epimerase [Panacibacter ginsenosidivorans]|uniref:Sugar phosphate isomerase/epimerase n=1 Tax=Panacibacter ginsenosidivorans TaxID=1813871 RepID=A0A5B8VFP9_9BACT|nr:TIM barrel protein [Panacibacter ginsenosidivorans]QEC69881.1 sugar phosphate isomerase/epimerase [Panacibacter ginsenosidivorans]
MKQINRRSFLTQTTKAAGAAIVLSQLPKQLLAGAAENNLPIGFQSWTVKDKLSADFPGTLKMMADMGYKMIEMCSPKGYAQIGFGAFTLMKTADIKKTINDAGLTCPSCHFGSAEFADDKIDDSIQFAQDMGLTQMICSTFWLLKTATLDDYKAAAEKLNKAAEKIKAAGMQAGFHNHEFEFAKLDGQLIYDALMKTFDSNLVKMQFQTEVINLGYKAADYFKKYPGRFISSHLSDWTADKKEAPVGQGVIDWKEFFAAAKIGGVKNFFVEMDPDKFKDSAAYIHAM